MPDNKNQNEVNQNEFEVPTPHRKNEDVTTTGEKDNTTGEDRNTRSEKDSDKAAKQQTGFETGQRSESEKQERPDRQEGIEKKERKERENPDSPVYQDTAQNADWQQNKLNEANNQPGTPVNEKGMADESTTAANKETFVSDKKKEKGNLGDTRKDSIIDSPRTETYKEDPVSDVGNEINRANYNHVSEEEKRDRNRQ